MEVESFGLGASPDNLNDLDPIFIWQFNQIREDGEEATQLEWTLNAYLPFLSRTKEFKIGKYCGAYGMCNKRGNYNFTRAFLPYKKECSTIIASSSSLASQPPFLTRNSAYSTSKLGRTRFYEFLAVEHPDLHVFILQPGIVYTALYSSGELALHKTLNTSKLTHPQPAI